jgi:hypothetical protein
MTTHTDRAQCPECGSYLILRGDRKPLCGNELCNWVAPNDYPTIEQVVASLPIDDFTGREAHGSGRIEVAASPDVPIVWLDAEAVTVEQANMARAYDPALTFMEQFGLTREAMLTMPAAFFQNLLAVTSALGQIKQRAEIIGIRVGFTVGPIDVRLKER